MFAFYQAQKGVGWEMPESTRLDDLIGQIFQVLNQEKVSPEEGFIIAEEILISSIQRLAKSNNLSVEELRQKLIERLTPQHPSAKKLMIGSGRGWVGNPKTITENN